MGRRQMGVEFVVVLDEATGNPPSDLEFFRLPPPNVSCPYELRFFILAGSACQKKAALVTNYPAREKFSRDVYQRLTFPQVAGADGSVSLSILTAGVFEYYLEYEDGSASVRESKVRGKFVVEPCLYLKEPYILPTTPGNTELALEQNKLLPLDGISCITVIPKWLPKLSQWPHHFDSIRKSCYNMVHFGPLQQRGLSDSPYSIYDQLAFSDDLFDTRDLPNAEKDKLMEEAIAQLYKDFRLLSITDVVWNHTANNSAWLLKHPEAGYNLVNSPHLKPAFALDDALLDFSERLAVDYGLNAELRSEGELSSVMNVLETHIIPPLRLYEFFVVNVQEQLELFSKRYAGVQTFSVADRSDVDELLALRGKSPYDQALALKTKALHRTLGWGRFSLELTFSDAYAVLSACLNLVRNDLTVERSPAALALLREKLESLLNDVNLPLYEEYDADIKAVYTNIRHRASYLRVADHGPKLERISRKVPLVDTYFTRLSVSDMTLEKRDVDLSRLANNGWIWNADPLVDFASENSKAYFRRDVIAWGDCVKLRYGKGPSDCPWLWEHMRSYTRKLASMFDGFRIDNCHSTPIHVASYLLDEARSVNSNLYVIAELFTGSEARDQHFVGELGINSLIREAMQAWDSFELSRQVHRNGGIPVGSTSLTANSIPMALLGHSTVCSETSTDLYRGEKLQVSVRGSNKPHVLFMDCTHDNETPNQKRTAEDTLSNAAVVAMSSCAIGSVRGYDQLVPTLLNLVEDRRKYMAFKYNQGISPAKAILNHLHEKLAREHYTEIHVHHENDFISIHRVHPITHDGYLLIARTAFHRHGGRSSFTHSPIVLPNTSVHLVLSASLSVTNGDDNHNNPTDRLSLVDPHRTELYDSASDFIDASYPVSPSNLFHSFSSLSIDRVPEAKSGYSADLIEGMPSELVFSTNLTTLCHCDYSPESKTSTIFCNADTFVPGSVVVFRTSMLSLACEPTHSSELRVTINGQREAGDTLEHLWGSVLDPECKDRAMAAISAMARLGNEPPVAAYTFMAPLSSAELKGCFDKVDACALNILLYRVPAEESDVLGPESGAYEVPNHGKLAYCGLQGFISVLHPISRVNWLDHPLFQNLREGDWALDYITSRLQSYINKNLGESLRELVAWIKARFDMIKRLPRTYVPKYFCFVLNAVYRGALQRFRAIANWSGECTLAFSSLNYLDLMLSLGSVQMNGQLNSTRLFSKCYPDLSDSSVVAASLAAGLPHFTTGHMRCWGRDVFIALKGLFLMNGQFSEARNHLLAFGSTMYRGLIPNLLDSGHRPRFNARDAVWWWLYAVQEYCKLSPEGLGFLKAKVYRRFPGNEYVEESDSRAFQSLSSVAELVCEALASHASGIHFQEWNAGKELDHAMKMEGFDIDIHCDILRDKKDRNGLVFGGNRWNCGTWMDKMGDSNKAKNAGVPATPRDGAPIEITGLLKATLRWVAEVLKSDSSLLPVSGVQSTGGAFVSFEEWNEVLQESFEAQYYVPFNPDEDEKYNIIDPQLINRRGVYRDVVNTSHAFAAFQLRPNFAVAMVVAPELFDPEHALKCLEIAQTALCGPLGVKTLDPSDWAFRGVYDNALDNDDYNTAHGFNYHQGPEWLWVQGYLYRAFLHFASKRYGASFALAKVTGWLTPHKALFFKSMEFPYAGLPELTQAGGHTCHGSCDTQAWSMSCFKELLQDMRQLLN